MLQFLLYMPVF